MNILQYTGRGHVHFKKELPCQDYADAVSRGTQTDILALSDGCGAYDLSGFASKANVDTVLAFFEEGRCDPDRLYADAEQTKKEILSAIGNALEEIRRMLDLTFTKSLAGTLLFAVWDRAKDKALLGHVGDGSILCFSRAGDLVFFSEPENGEKKNETYYTNAENAIMHFRLTLLDTSEISDIVLLSDGPEIFFQNSGDGDLVTGVRRFLERLHENRIETCCGLWDELRDAYADEIINIEDDWSILIGNRTAPPCADRVSAPDQMTYQFLKRYLSAHPEAFESAEDDYRKASEEYETERIEFNAPDMFERREEYSE